MAGEVPASPANGGREDYRQIPWDGFEASCPVCHTLVEWVADPALYERIRNSDYPGQVRLIRKVEVGSVHGIEQEVFVVVCPNANCGLPFFHYKQLWNAREIDEATERRRMRPSTPIPDAVYAFQEGSVSEFLEELKREPNRFVRERVLRRLRDAGVSLPMV
ncbi:MAG TPA: hypothetical protein VMG99_08770 [Thermoplasmata archaeon]|nr:hypothetical protein [Thermoplasmata archaeon]